MVWAFAEPGELAHIIELKGAIMGSMAKELLETFEKLEPAERQEVAAEILRRAAGSGDLEMGAYGEIARDLFEMYEKEESDGGKN